MVTHRHNSEPLINTIVTPQDIITYLSLQRPFIESSYSLKEFIFSISDDKTGALHTDHTPGSSFIVNRALILLAAFATLAGGY